MSLTAVILCGIVLLVFAGVAIGIYNAIVTVRNNVENAWKNIDVVLQQRHDELPKLIDTCTAYMKHEWDLLNRLTELRSGYAAIREIDDKVKAENELNRLLGNLSMVWEQYPDLKANQNFLQIQDRVSGVEAKIADYREAFNNAVNIYNIQIERFPDLILAKAMSCRRHPFLEVPEEKKQDVQMAFGN